MVGTATALRSAKKKVHKRSICTKPAILHRVDKLMKKWSGPGSLMGNINRMEQLAWEERRRNPMPVPKCDGCLSRFRGTPPDEDDEGNVEDVGDAFACDEDQESAFASKGSVLINEKLGYNDRLRESKMGDNRFLFDAMYMGRIKRTERLGENADGKGDESFIARLTVLDNDGKKKRLYPRDSDAKRDASSHQGYGTLTPSSGAQLVITLFAKIAHSQKCKANFGVSYCLSSPCYLDGDGRKPYHSDRHPEIAGSGYDEANINVEHQFCNLAAYDEALTGPYDFQRTSVSGIAIFLHGRDQTGSPSLAPGLAACTKLFLKTKLGFDNFTVYENGFEVGALWGGCSDIQIHCLYQHIAFNTKVLSAEWDNARQQRITVVEDVFSGKRMTSVAHIVIFALGILEIPNIPYNSWSVDVSRCFVSFRTMARPNPSVGVINFFRTPTWFNTQLVYPFLLPMSDKALHEQRELQAATCKQVVANGSFPESFHWPNLMLNFDGIAEIVEKGIITKTGCQLQKQDWYPMHVQGYYDTHGGPTAYIGIAIPDISNF
ncbi:hypothetical protein EDB19DRAFT_1834616 [Suillus lakei]|nr:hypothetical protein EDB19DRAFT_1834616 [Suillus lakei]